MRNRGQVQLAVGAEGRHHRDGRASHRTRILHQAVGMACLERDLPAGRERVAGSSVEGAIGASGILTMSVTLPPARGEVVVEAVLLPALLEHGRAGVIPACAQVQVCLEPVVDPPHGDQIDRAEPHVPHQDRLRAALDLDPARLLHRQLIQQRMRPDAGEAGNPVEQHRDLRPGTARALAAQIDRAAVAAAVAPDQVVPGDDDAGNAPQGRLDILRVQLLDLPRPDHGRARGVAVDAGVIHDRGGMDHDLGELADLAVAAARGPVGRRGVSDGDGGVSDGDGRYGSSGDRTSADGSFGGGGRGVYRACRCGGAVVSPLRRGSLTDGRDQGQGGEQRGKNVGGAERRRHLLLIGFGIGFDGLRTRQRLNRTWRFGETQGPACFVEPVVPLFLRGLDAGSKGNRAREHILPRPCFPVPSDAAGRGYWPRWEPRVFRVD